MTPPNEHTSEGGRDDRGVPPASTGVRGIDPPYPSLGRFVYLETSREGRPQASPRAQAELAFFSAGKGMGEEDRVPSTRAGFWIARQKKANS